jgi:NAD-dependent deacetylase
MEMPELAQIAGFIRSSSYIVAFTGAGASTESNIPDFRSTSGLYGKKTGYSYPPEVMLSHSFFFKHADQFYKYYRENLVYRDAKPNAAHISLARLEEEGKVRAVITQNIDGLHQAAGSNEVLELHGTIKRNKCTECGKSYSLDYIMESRETVPLCTECGAVIKPDVVLYEEMLDERVVDRAVAHIRRADMLMVIGTSLEVFPAAGLVNYYSGSRLVVINKSQTRYDNNADIVVHAAAGKVMSRVMEYLGTGICLTEQ